VSGDILCFSHLRWGFVFQRPNHLMARFAARQRTFFVEEPILDGAIHAPHMTVSRTEAGVYVCAPRIPATLDGPARTEAMRALLDELVDEKDIAPSVLWFYTPMALPYADHLGADVIVYDCMDELTAFKGAPAALAPLEAALFARADLVFTGGQSLYESKRGLHPQVHAFPSSVDAAHFRMAREPQREPRDQASIARPRAGYAGVIDERIDLALVESLADARPDVHLVFLGPIAKRDPAELPQRPNLHWLGMKSYETLPAYLAGWDVALMPFALNEATRFISPTKTLEYLAAGKPVVSTAIRDVVSPYGENGLVQIADAKGFAAALDRALAQDVGRHMAAADAFLAGRSWDATWEAMAALIAAAPARSLASTAARARAPAYSTT
jgi:glycosyltransferase involved in cell wall biosynthesis